MPYAINNTGQVLEVTRINHRVSSQQRTVWWCPFCDGSNQDTGSPCAKCQATKVDSQAQATQVGGVVQERLRASMGIGSTDVGAVLTEIPVETVTLGSDTTTVTLDEEEDDGKEKCAVCGRQITVGGPMTSHMRTHSGE